MKDLEVLPRISRRLWGCFVTHELMNKFGQQQWICQSYPFFCCNSAPLCPAYLLGMVVTFVEPLFSIAMVRSWLCFSCFRQNLGKNGPSHFEFILTYYGDAKLRQNPYRAFFFHGVEMFKNLILSIWSSFAWHPFINTMFSVTRNKELKTLCHSPELTFY